jgi:hypothetical protein
MISWTTDKQTTSQLFFGSSTAMVGVFSDTYLATHSRQITYYYELQSRDASGTIASSAQQSLPSSVRAVRKSSNMGGEFRLQRVLLATTNFGETDFGQQNAFVVEDQEDESSEFDGLLGPSALGLKQITIDFQRHTFSWAR